MKLFTLATFATVSAYTPLKLPFEKFSGNSHGNTQKRTALHNVTGSGKFEMDLTSQVNFYSVNLSIGTPPQNVALLVDTGAGDTWVMGKDNPYCINTTTVVDASSNTTDIQPTIDCSLYGTFDSDLSKTFHSNHTDFSIQYGDFSFAEGTWAQDSLAVGDLNVTGMSFVVANSSNSTVGVLGLGLPGLEVTSINKPGFQYNNLPLTLVSNGVIARNVYSLYLNDIQASEGELLFGAVDAAKFTGGLYTLPLVNSLKTQGIPTAIQFDVTLQGLGYIDHNGKRTTITTTQAVMQLDSGTTLAYFPQQMMDLIAMRLDAVFSEEDGFYLMKCPPDSGASEVFVFDFGGFQIQVPLSNFIVPSNHRKTCVLAILPTTSDNGVGVLGDIFLSSAYVVYDLDNLELSIGQAVFTNQSDIQVVTDKIPGAVKAPMYSSSFSDFATTSVAPTSYTSGGDIFTLSLNSTVTGINVQSLTSEIFTLASNSTKNSTLTSKNLGAGKSNSWTLYLSICLSIVGGVFI